MTPEPLKPAPFHILLALAEGGYGLEIVEGDTARVPFGMGTYGSRSAAVGGSAIATSVDKLIEKARQIAAHMLEAAPEDIEFTDGKFFVRGAEAKAKAWGEVVLAAYLAHDLPEGIEPGLETTSFYDPPNFSWPAGAHIAVVEADTETGDVRLLRYIAVDDVGNEINPLIVSGQLHGGIAQGVGQALWEGAVYSDDGQLLTGSMLDYALPKAARLPSFELDRTVTPSPIPTVGVGANLVPVMVTGVLTAPGITLTGLAELTTGKSAANFVTPACLAPATRVKAPPATSPAGLLASE